MRHIKWLTILCVVVVLAFGLMCTRALCSVADVNVTYSYYNQAQVQKANDLLSRYNGAFLPFVNTQEIVDLINENTGLKVGKITKKYPNVLQVELRERKETFAIKIGDKYFVLDDEYTVIDIRDNCKNSVDGLDNIILVFNNDNFDESTLSLRKSLDVGNAELLQAVIAMIGEFDSVRDVVKEIVVDEKEVGKNFYVSFNMLEGVSIEVRKAMQNSCAKIDLGLQKYLSLNDWEKLDGKVAVYQLDNGEIVATYTK